MTTAVEEVDGSASRPGRFLLRERPGTHVQEAGWAPGPGWTGAEYLALTGIRSPDRPTRSQSLYRLSYSAHVTKLSFTIFFTNILHNIFDNYCFIMFRSQYLATFRNLVSLCSWYINLFGRNLYTVKFTIQINTKVLKSLRLVYIF
jgi:hypothetical protein